MKVRLPGGSAGVGVVDLKGGSGEQLSLSEAGRKDGLDPVLNNGLAE
jgi:hypothetical protein